MDLLIRKGQLYLPLASILLVISMAVFLKGLSKDVEAQQTAYHDQQAQITTLTEKQDKYLDTVNRIDGRLNRIEGRLEEALK